MSNFAFAKELLELHHNFVIIPQTPFTFP